MLRELEAAIANRPEPIEEPVAEPGAPEPAKLLVMTAAAGSQAQQNNPQTAENDSFRRNAESGQSPRPSDQAERGEAIAAEANPIEKAF